MHFPVDSEKSLYIFMGKKIRRPMWTIQHVDLPPAAVMGNEFIRQRKRSMRDGKRLRFDNMQHVPSQKRSSPMPPKLTKGESGLAAEIIWNFETALHRQVRATTVICDFSKLNHRASLDDVGSPLRERLAVQPCIQERAAYRNDAVAIEAQGRPDKGDLEPSLGFFIIDQSICQTECEAIHGPGWRHPYAPVAGPPRVILYRWFARRG